MAEAKNDDGLFLLEALVDKVTFVKAPCFSDQEFRTCVSLQCSGLQPLEICDDDLPTSHQISTPNIKNFNIGKSCLFSLKQPEIMEAMTRFLIKVAAYTLLPSGCLPSKVLIGEATIDMTKEFVRARQKFFEDPTAISYEALKDTFRISTPDGSEAGDIVMFLRITYFGSMIITRFQGAGAPPAPCPTRGSVGNSRLGKQPELSPLPTSNTKCSCGAVHSDKEGSDRTFSRNTPSSGFLVCPATAVYQATTTPPGQTSPTGSAQSHPKKEKKSDQKHCPHSAAGKSPCSKAVDPYNSMPCEEPDDPCYCCGPKPEPKQQMLCRNTDQYCLHVPKGRTKQYEEIGSNLNGNELKIKVPASASIIKKISQTHCAMQTPYVKGGGGDKNAGGPCISPCGKNQISMALPNEAVCCRGERPQTTQFTCTTEGCTQASKHGQANRTAEKPGAKLVNNDVFVLKVAKTATQGDAKCKLELELVTPKGPDKDVPVEKITRRMQCDPDCDCNRLKKPQKKKKLY